MKFFESDFVATKIVQLEFVGTDLSTGTVFDRTTSKPVTVILGKGELHKALEEEIQKMKAGEQKKIVLQPEQAFGERKAESIVVIPLKNFLDNKMNPFPGMVFEANGMNGKVQSVSGGRVRVDFNNPLAGKALEYDLKLVKEISEKKEAITALFEKFLPLGEEKDRKFELKGEELTLWLPKQIDLKNAEPLKKVLEKIFTENIDGIKKINFIESTEAKTETIEKEKESKEKTEKKSIEETGKAEKEKSTEQKRSLVQSKKKPQGQKAKPKNDY